MGLAALLSGLIMALCVSHPHCHGNIKGFKSSHENSSLLKSHFHFLFLSLSAACTIFSQTLGSPTEIRRADRSWQPGLTDSVAMHPMATASGNRFRLRWITTVFASLLISQQKMSCDVSLKTIKKIPWGLNGYTASLAWACDGLDTHSCQMRNDYFFFCQARGMIVSILKHKASISYSNMTVIIVIIMVIINY